MTTPPSPRRSRTCSIPALLCSLVHMTGDPSWIRERCRCRSMPMRQRPPEQVSTPRSWPTSVAARCPRSPPTATAAASRTSCPRDVLLEMMAFLAGKPLEGTLGADVPRGPAVRRRRQRRDLVGRRGLGRGRRRRRPVVVIGCGLSGILAGIRLCRRRGCPSRSSRRTPARAAPGGRTATRVPASTSAATTTATRSSPPITGPSTSASSPSCATTSSACSTSTACGRTAASSTAVTSLTWDDRRAAGSVGVAEPGRDAPRCSTPGS